MNKIKTLLANQGLRHGTCGYCNGQISENDGDMVCTKCGIVYDQHIINYDIDELAKDGKSVGGRTGAPVKQRYGDSAISSVISLTNKDAGGKSFDSNMNVTLKRLRVWDTRTKRTSSERSFTKAASEITKLIEKLGLSEHLLDEAISIYSKAQNQKITRGRNLNVIATACVYAACRQTMTPRTLKDLAVVSGIKKADISAIYRYMLNNMEMKLPIMDPKKYVSKIISKLNLRRPEFVARFALNMITESNNGGHSAGKDPSGLAACAVYMAAHHYKENITQRNLSVAGEVTEVTIRNRTRAIIPIYEKIIKDDSYN